MSLWPDRMEAQSSGSGSQSLSAYGDVYRRLGRVRKALVMLLALSVAEEVTLLVLLNSLLCHRTIPECGQLKASSGIGCRLAGCYGAGSH